MARPILFSQLICDWLVYFPYGCLSLLDLEGSSMGDIWNLISLTYPPNTHMHTHTHTDTHTHTHVTYLYPGLAWHPFMAISSHLRSAENRDRITSSAQIGAHPNLLRTTRGQNSQFVTITEETAPHIHQKLTFHYLYSINIRLIYTCICPLHNYLSFLV